MIKRERKTASISGNRKSNEKRETTSDVRALSNRFGAPVRLTKDQQAELKNTIVNFVPHDVGFTARHNWTLELIAEFIKREFGYTYSLRGISKMMHRQGLSYTKPSYTLAAADEEKQKIFVESTFPDLKKDI